VKRTTTTRNVVVVVVGVGVVTPTTEVTLVVVVPFPGVVVVVVVVGVVVNPLAELGKAFGSSEVSWLAELMAESTLLMAPPLPNTAPPAKPWAKPVVVVVTPAGTIPPVWQLLSAEQVVAASVIWLASDSREAQSVGNMTWLET